MCLHVYVCALPGKAILEMTCTVLGKTVNSPHSLVVLGSQCIC